MVWLDNTNHLMLRNQAVFAKRGLKSLDETLLFTRLDNTPVFGHHVTVDKDHSITHVLQCQYHDYHEAHEWKKYVALKTHAKQTKARRQRLADAILEGWS